MSRPTGVAPRAERAMGRYLLDDEEIVVAVHQHWRRVVGVVSATFLALALVVTIGIVTPPTIGMVSDVAWWMWLALLGYAAIEVTLWRHDWFVATDKRLLLTYGLVTRRVAMMPLSKVTDMSFSQSVPGRMLGYGTYVLESAGQEQALRQVEYIPDADLHYRTICAEIFGEEVAGDEDDQSPHHHAYDSHNQRPATADDTDPYGVPVPPRAVPAHASGARSAYGDNRRRVVRAATVASHDPDAAWGISHEDASGPERP